jgi:hypothetical protein
MSSTPTTDKYFAAEDFEHIVDRLKEVDTNSVLAAEQRGLYALWRLLWCQAHGINPDTGVQETQALQFVGPDANYVRFRVNMTRGHIKQRIQLAQGDRIAYRAIAMNHDAASIAQVPIAGALMDYVVKTTRLDHFAARALEADGFFGEGYLWVRWDPEAGEKVPTQVQATDDAGEPIMMPEVPGAPPTPTYVTQQLPSGAPVVQHLFPWQVSKDPYQEDPSWVIVHEPISKYELAGRFSELSAKILSVDNLFRRAYGMAIIGWNNRGSTNDTVILSHFYHKSCAAVPGGRYVGYCDDIPLWDEPCPSPQGIPVTSICTARVFGLSYGYAESADLMSMQEMIDELLSQSANNAMRFGNQNLVIEDGIDFDKDEIAKGGAVFRKKSKQDDPKAVQLAEMPEIAKYLLEYLPTRMNEISGLNSVTRGQPEYNITSGSFAALMLNIAERYQGATQASYDQAVTRVGNLILQFIQARASSGFVAEVAGHANDPYLHYFSQQDLQSIRRVEIERASPVLNSIPGRFEVFDKLSGLSKPQRREAAELILTGSMDAFLEDDTSQIALIRWENEQLLQGVNPPCLVSDDARSHNLAHRTLLDKVRCMPPSPQRDQIITVVLQHISDQSMAWAGLDPVMALTLDLPIPPTQQLPTTGQSPAPTTKQLPAGQPPSPQMPQLPESAQPPAEMQR